MKKIMLGCALMVMAAVGFGGCDTVQSSTEDQNLTRMVSERLYQDKDISRQVLSVSVHDGVATLHGVIADEGLRARAKGIVLSTPGVTNVVDQTVRQ